MAKFSFQIFVPPFACRFNKSKFSICRNYSEALDLFFIWVTSLKRLTLLCFISRRSRWSHARHSWRRRLGSNTRYKKKRTEINCQRYCIQSNFPKKLCLIFCQIHTLVLFCFLRKYFIPRRNDYLFLYRMACPRECCIWYRVDGGRTDAGKVWKKARNHSVKALFWLHWRQDKFYLGAPIGRSLPFTN